MVRRQLHAASADVLALLLSDIDAGLLEIPIEQTFPLEKVVTAHTLLEQRHSRGKMILHRSSGARISD